MRRSRRRRGRPHWRLVDKRPEAMLLSAVVGVAKSVHHDIHGRRLAGIDEHLAHSAENENRKDVTISGLFAFVRLLYEHGELVKAMMRSCTSSSYRSGLLAENETLIAASSPGSTPTFSFYNWGITGEMHFLPCAVAMTEKSAFVNCAAI